MSSPRARLALAGALALTLGAKAALTRDAAEPDAGLFADRAEAALRAGGFETGRITPPFGTLLLGRKHGCTILAAEYPPNGTFADSIAQYGRAVGPLLYFWRGRSAARAPKIVPLTEYFIGRELRRIGLRPARHPIVAYAASPGCAAPPVDWAPIARLPR